MSRYGRADLDCKVYIGDLPRDASEKEVERACGYYGALRSVWVARNPPGFAFVEFEDPRDADDCVRGLDGSSMCGGRIRVELSNGKVRTKPWQRHPQRSVRRAFDPSDKCYECGDRGHYAYDCRSRSRGSHRRSRSRSRSYDRRRSYSRSRSRSRNYNRSLSKSPRRHIRSRSRS